MSARLDRAEIPARTALAALAVAIFFFLHAAVPVAQAWARAAAFFGDAVLRLPQRPLTLVAPDPRVSELTWANDGRGQLTLPGGDGPHPGLVVVLGARAASPDDPRVVRLTDGLARIGFAVLLPKSDDLDGGRVVPAEIDRLVAAQQALSARPTVKQDRVGFIGLSAGGSLTIVAAAHPAIRDTTWFVLAIGPYYDARDLVAETVSGTYRDVDGSGVGWEPRAITKEVVRETLLAALGADDRAAVEGGRAAGSAGGRAVADLLAGMELERARALIATLPPAEAASLAAISPRDALHGLRAPLYLMHDRSDPFIPLPHSELLVRAHRPAVFHRTEIFEHVDPKITSVGPLLRDGWRMHRLFVRILLDGR
ncbi:MAG: hypothetical protein FJZ92_12175 [Chloroflexi bacterium]|nr:hypothetical protein [Chloroflexota bacterium]